MSFFVLLPFSPNELSAFGVATVGGVFVLAGLALEKIADWLNENFIPGSYKPHKIIGSAGWWILMFGIGIETSVAGFSAVGEYRDAPRNQRVATLTATVDIVSRGTNLTFIDLENESNLSFVQLSLANSTYLPSNNWPATINLTSFKKQLGIEGTSNPIIVWHLQFVPDSGRIIWASGEKVTLEEATKWNSVRLSMGCLPKNTEILFGTVNVTINSQTNRIFEIDDQKTIGYKDKSLLPVTVVSFE